MRRRIWIFAAVMTLVVASVVGYAVVTSAGEAAPAEILARVAADFDAHADEVRVVAILSPT